MYTPHQIDCLKQMGVEFLNTQQVPVLSEQSQLASLTNESNVELAASLIKDLQVLFPELNVEGSIIQLNDQYKWRFQAGSTRLLATKTQLITSPPEHLSAKDWRQIWHHLGQHTNA